MNGMNDLSLKSDKAKYDIILHGLLKGVVIIDIKEKYEDGFIEEAVGIAKKYNPKKIFISTKFELDGLKEYRRDLIFSNQYTLTKSYKEIKLVEVSITSREDFIKLVNYNKDLSESEIDVMDALNIIKNKNNKCYFIMYKDKKIGVFVINDSEILYFTCTNMLVYDMCLSKVLYKIGHNTKISVSSLENTKINKFKSFGFELTGTQKIYYEV